MGTLFVNSETRKTSEPYILILRFKKRWKEYCFIKS